MYSKINNHPRVWEKYIEKVIGEGLVSKEEV